MRIAVIMAGHMRSWDYCKENFLQNVYDPNHDIDVFVETYYDIFRTDYRVRNEDQMNIKLTSDEICAKFNGINVTYYNVEDEVLGLSQSMHKRKLLMAYEAVVAEETRLGKYDLILKYRFDLLADHKLNYDYYLKRCELNRSLIFIGEGAVYMDGENDMAAVTHSDNMKTYMNRLNEYSNDDPMLFHSSLSRMSTNHNIRLIQNLNISIVRLDGNGNYQVEK
jgi:hypothetical protein